MNDIKISQSNSKFNKNLYNNCIERMNVNSTEPF